MLKLFPIITSVIVHTFHDINFFGKKGINTCIKIKLLLIVPGLINNSFENISINNDSEKENELIHFGFLLYFHQSGLIFTLFFLNLSLLFQIQFIFVSQ